ncbi:MAG: hypothetical protein U0105_18065 [Candidatus Obscuribacterales bacterium]
MRDGAAHDFFLFASARARAKLRGLELRLAKPEPIEEVAPGDFDVSEVNGQLALKEKKK